MTKEMRCKFVRTQRRGLIERQYGLCLDRDASSSSIQMWPSTWWRRPTDLICRRTLLKTHQKGLFFGLDTWDEPDCQCISTRHAQLEEKSDGKGKDSTKGPIDKVLKNAIIRLVKFYLYILIYIQMGISLCPPAPNQTHTLTGCYSSMAALSLPSLPNLLISDTCGEAYGLCQSCRAFSFNRCSI